MLKSLAMSRPVPAWISHGQVVDKNSERPPEKGGCWRSEDAPGKTETKKPASTRA